MLGTAVTALNVPFDVGMLVPYVLALEATVYNLTSLFGLEEVVPFFHSANALAFVPAVWMDGAASEVILRPEGACAPRSEASDRTVWKRPTLRSRRRL